MKKERKLVTERLNLIKNIIRKVESTQPLKEWKPGEIEQELKNSNNEIPHRRFFSYLNKLVKRGYIKKIRRGYYLSKYSLFWKKTVQNFLVKSVYETVPKIEGRVFDEFVSATASSLAELSEDDAEKKGILAPILNLSKLKRINYRRKLLENNMRENMRRDFDFVQKATDITILVTKRIQPDFKTKLREALATILRDVIVHERNLALANGKQFILDDFGLNIIVSFDPKKAGVPHSFERTMQESIKIREETAYWKLYEELDLELPEELAKLDKMTRKDRETLERDKALLKRIRQHVNDVEEEAKLGEKYT